VEVLTSITHDKYLLLLLMIVILLCLGTFMDLAPLIIICTPIFLPVAKAIGIDPVHFGVISDLERRLGPDYPAHRLSAVRRRGHWRISIVDVLRTIWPFYLSILGVLLVWRMCRRCRFGSGGVEGGWVRGAKRRRQRAPLALAADLLAPQLPASLGDCRRDCRALRMRCTPFARFAARR